MDPTMHDIEIHVKRTGWLLAGAVAFLGLAGALGQVLTYRFGRTWGFGLIPEFYLDAENTLPTYFAALLLLVSAALLAVIASARRRARDPYRWHWTVLAGTFLLLSIDEATSLHELLIDPMRSVVGPSSWLHFAWVVPAAFAVLAFFFAYVGFLRHLDASIRTRMLVAGGLYVAATLGVETLGARQAFHAGQENLTYALIATAEETLEMVAIALFVVTLLRYMAEQVPDIRFRTYASRAEGHSTD